MISVLRRSKSSSLSAPATLRPFPATAFPEPASALSFVVSSLSANLTVLLFMDDDDDLLSEELRIEVGVLLVIVPAFEEVDGVDIGPLQLLASDRCCPDDENVVEDIEEI